MGDLKEIIERELDQYLEWPTADKSHVTTVSAKLFAEHVARLYADHIADAGKMVSDQLRGGTKKIGRPQIREVFMRNGFTIKPDRDDLHDYVYEAAFELLEMAAPDVHGEPVGWQFYQHGEWRNGDDRIKDHRKNTKEAGFRVRDVYTAPQPVPDVAGLVEALEWLRGAINCTPENDKHQSGAWISTSHPRIKQIDELLAAHHKGGDV